MANYRPGYARVSTLEQDPASQLAALAEAGCQEVFTDHASGLLTERPELTRLLDQLRKGDELVVWRLDRLGRSTSHLFELITELGERGIGFTHSPRLLLTAPPWSSIPVPDTDDGPVSEGEQEHLVQALHRHLAEGRLDLEQFDLRVAQLYGAVTRTQARAALAGLPLLDAPLAGRRARRRHGETGRVQPHWVATDEVFRDPTSGRVMRVWIDPTDGVRHYAQAGP